MAVVQRLLIVTFALLIANFQVLTLPVKPIQVQRERIPFLRTFRPTTTPNGCKYKGKLYGPGEEIMTGRSDNWCYGKYCDESGQIVNWDNFNCGPTTASTTHPPTTASTTMPPTTLPTTSAPTTTPPSTKSHGCVYEGKFYPKNSEISKGKEDSWCYGVLCDSDGEVVHWDNFHCNPTTPSTTIPPTTASTTMPPTTLPTTSAPTTTPPSTKTHGCFHEGKFYPKNSEISKGKEDSWCYGVLCDSDGEVVHWDNFECHTATTPTFPPTTPLRTTEPVTTPDSTTPSGCYYGGKWYRPGSEISNGRSGNWCFGLYCDYNGNPIPWDNFRCGTTPTTAPATSAPTSVSTSPPRT